MLCYVCKIKGRNGLESVISRGCMWPGEPSARGVAPFGLTEFQVLQRASVSLDAQRPVGERAGLA